MVEHGKNIGGKKAEEQETEAPFQLQALQASSGIL